MYSQAMPGGCLVLRNFCVVPNGLKASEYLHDRSLLCTGIHRRVAVQTALLMNNGTDPVLIWFFVTQMNIAIRVLSEQNFN